jgi:hypothetical protein
MFKCVKFFVQLAPTGNRESHSTDLFNPHLTKTICLGAQVFVMKVSSIAQQIRKYVASSTDDGLDDLCKSFDTLLEAGTVFGEAIASRDSCLSVKTRKRHSSTATKIARVELSVHCDGSKSLLWSYEYDHYHCGE